MTPTTATEREIASQPAVWQEAADLAQGSAADALPDPGTRVAFAGCGTSYHVAQALSVLRERQGLGETDAFPASEAPTARSYDHWVLISRSGTTTEASRLLETLAHDSVTTLLTADASSPMAHMARHVVALTFANEQSVVQTRFATAVLALLRAYMGDDIAQAVVDAHHTVAADLPLPLEAVRQWVLLGRGWTTGLAHEGALKLREAASVWAESYPTLEYRHGPIAVAGPQSLIWGLQPLPDDLQQEIERTGATVRQGRFDPMAEIIFIQRCAVSLAKERGLDPDRPLHLRRSVILDT